MLNQLLGFLYSIQVFFLGCPEQTFPVKTIKVSSISMQVYVARTDCQLSQGLMNRKELTTDGMLFVFDKEEKLSFWMKDTIIPLDIAIFDEKMILKEIKTMKPLDTTPTNFTYPGRYALEVNKGFFLKNNIEPGSKLILNRSN